MERKVGSLEVVWEDQGVRVRRTSSVFAAGVLAGLVGLIVVRGEMAWRSACLVGD